MKADFTIPTAAEELGIEELDEHDKVVGEEGTAAKAKAKQSHHQRSGSLTFFRSNNLKIYIHVCMYVEMLHTGDIRFTWGADIIQMDPT